jgi:hypothetical protein
VNAPTATDVQGWTQLDALKSAPADRLERFVAIANATLLRITGLTWESVPPEQEPLVQQAVQGIAEMTTFQQAPETLETLSDFDLIASFNAGPYSETRRSPGEAMKARLLVAWPWLSSLLWTLLTPDQYDYWRAFFSNVPAPAFDVQEVDWSAGQDLLGGSYQADPGYFFGA